MNHYSFWEVFWLSGAAALGWNCMDAVSEGAIDGIFLAFKVVFKIGFKPTKDEK